MKIKSTCLAIVVFMLIAISQADVEIDWVTVGDSGNANDNTGYGGVSGTYRISKYEITVNQYCEFLNAVASVDPYGLYYTNMKGIERFGTSGNFSYIVKSSYEDKPINYVSFYDAIRFSNWLHNGQGMGDTESGAYTILNGGPDSGILGSRNPDAAVFVPNTNEWYKAAFYKGGGTNAGYWTYATQSDSPPVDELPPGGSNSANYNYVIRGVSVVGAYELSESFYGTYDQSGNLLEWTETIGHLPSGARILIGGNYVDPDATYLGADYVGHRNTDPGVSFMDVYGFRVASIPEPALTLSVDIKPASCPNVLNVKNKGILPVAILGSEEFDVATIDPASIFLNGVPAIRSSLEDVATPLTDPNECECTTAGPDGFTDLTLKFDTQQIVESLGEVYTDDILTLPLTGVLYDETLIEGADCIVIKGRHKPINIADVNKDGVVNAVDMAIVAENWLESSIVK